MPTIFIHCRQQFFHYFGQYQNHNYRSASWFHIVQHKLIIHSILNVDLLCTHPTANLVPDDIQVTSLGTRPANNAVHYRETVHFIFSLSLLHTEHMNEGLKLFLSLRPKPFRYLLYKVHSHKILTKQQGWPRGVSSVGNPRQALTGFVKFARV